LETSIKVRRRKIAITMELFEAAIAIVVFSRVMNDKARLVNDCAVLLGGGRRCDDLET
jgi:hypothetical protein